MAEVKKEEVAFTNKDVAAKYRITNPDHATAIKVTPKGHRALKDITVAIAEFLVKTLDADIEELPVAKATAKTN